MHNMKAIYILLVIVFAATFLGCEPDPTTTPLTTRLCQKDADLFPSPTVPYTPTPCEEGGTSARLDYLSVGPEFNYWLDGTVPDPDQDYRLIYYPDPWPANGLVCLSGPITPNVDGWVSYQECFETDGSLPKDFDENYPDGAKIWLVRDIDSF